MGTEEFISHLTDFMKYVRQMDPSIEYNSEKVDRFQKVLLEKADSLLDEISGDKNLDEFQTILNGIKSWIVDYPNKDISCKK